LLAFKITRNFRKGEKSMKRNSWKKKHKVEVIIVKPDWEELDPEEKEKILIAATGLYKAETGMEEDVFTAWKERGK
jgi:hypothetical protein